MLGEKSGLSSQAVDNSDKVLEKPQIQNSENLYQIELRKKIKHFILTNKIEEAKELIKMHFETLWK